jgi:endonuclease YncB( thermonuclease family)
MRRLHLAIIGAAALVAAAAIAGSGDNLSGHPRVIDGDTIAIGSTHIRLFGIDAPESKQTCTDDIGLRYWCGTVATAALSEEIGRATVDCRKVDTDRYGRVVAMCMVDGRDLGAEMVRHGWATEYREYSQGLYDDDEAAARAAKRGIWRGEFEEPARWRAEHRQ